MGATRDFVAATVADALLPTFRRPVEDIIYETLDRRQVPTRTDFKEMRDLVNSLRGQASGTASGVRKLAERSEDIEETLDQIEARLERMEAGNERLLRALESAESLAARVNRLEAAMLTQEKLDERLAAFRQTLPAPGLSADRASDLIQQAVDALRDELSTPAPAPEPAPAPAPEPAVAEPEVASEPELIICKVEGCDTEARARGFCARHYQRWRRGTLKGAYVSLEGEVDIGGQTHKVDPTHAGEPYTVVDGAVLISGEAVSLES